MSKNKINTEVMKVGSLKSKVIVYSSPKGHTQLSYIKQKKKFHVMSTTLLTMIL